MPVPRAGPSPRALALLGAVLLAACSAAPPPRPNLPPPEYEEPGGVLAGVQSLGPDAGAVGAPVSPKAP